MDLGVASLPQLQTFFTISRAVGISQKRTNEIKYIVVMKSRRKEGPDGLAGRPELQTLFESRF